MIRGALTIGVVACVLAVSATPAAAQDFGIYTQVFRLPPPGAGSRQAGGTIVSRSVSLFHAGKVYDHTGDEIVIFEPAHNRFTLLNTEQHLATVVHMDEVKQLLKIAREETEHHLAWLREQKTSTAAKAQEQLSFTLDPQFDESLDDGGTRLKLTSRHLRYHVTCTKSETPETVETYLRYADWAARLNYVLHPHVLLPETRLALNASLLRKRLLPVEVELHAEIGTPIHLRAQHQYHWELDSQHRALINGWEQFLKEDTTKHVTFQEYQRTTLVTQLEKRR
jgi:hypothetical protein